MKSPTMKALFTALFITLCFSLAAQHCPWDCSGLLMIKTSAGREELKKLDPVLVGPNKKPIIDTIYGTGSETFDLCRFMYYDDFLQYRINRIKIHHWYTFDTRYHFARDHYIVRFNFCRYDSDGPPDLYIRINDRGTNNYKYIEIPKAKRIHLHDIGREISKGETETLIEKLSSYVITL